VKCVVVKLPSAKRGFVFLPRRWAGERAFGWTARLRRLVRDYERLADTLKGLHQIALAILFVKKLVELLN
jgi:transposase